MSAAERVAEALPRVDPTIEPQIRERVSEMPPICVNAYLKAMRGRAPKAAIKAFCEMCMGWEDRIVQISGCTDPACPLYPYRPYKNTPGA